MKECSLENELKLLYEGLLLIQGKNLIDDKLVVLLRQMVGLMLQSRCVK